MSSSASSGSEGTDLEDEIELNTPVVQKRKGRPPKSASKKLKPVEAKQQEEECESGSDDEFDESGEGKVTKDGFLLGGREYRFPTFTLPRHPNRLYLFSLDASKVLGYRDTYIFFLRCPKVKRVNGTEEDREHLIKMGMLPSALKNRAIIMVRARNIFKVFGHQVVRRGKPIRDDYICSGKEETFEAPTEEEEMPSFATYDLKITSSLEGGPFRKHGVSLCGFNQKEPDFEPKEIGLDKEDWMYKCCLSAADFNHRLSQTKPISFLDLHTNIEQIPVNTQPKRIFIEKNQKDSSNVLKIDTDVVCNPHDPKWIPIETSQTTKFPISIMRNQFQESYSLFPFRFKESDVMKPVTLNRYDMEQPLHLYGVQPFQPISAPFKKRIRARKVDGGSGEMKDQCAYCQQNASSSGSLLLISCYKCRMKHHPECIEFEDPVLISKCQTYNWACSNCKLCETCKKPTHDDKLLFCDVCDRATHMFCLDPPLDELPEGRWICSLCSFCHSCKKKETKRDWNHIILPDGDENRFLCTLCDRCSSEFNHNQFCPVCIQTYSPDDDELAMVCCDKCERWIHVGCDPLLSTDMYQELAEQESPNFTCILCETKRRDRYMASMGDRKLSVVDYQGHKLVCPPLKQ